jgi:3-oxoacyl-[acyl-carrier-protein] synthase II
MNPDVWITGVGPVTPLGHDFSTFAEKLLAGTSGVVARQLLNAESGGCQCFGAVDAIPRPSTCDPAAFARLSRLEQLGLSCTTRALQDAGLWSERSQGRIGLVMGLGGEHMRTWELDIQKGGTRVYDPNQDTQSLVHFLRGELDLCGPAVAVAAACASGGYALELARRWLELGWIDVCLAGSCDLATPMTYAGFYNLRALCRRNDSPAAMSRPFDRARDGFVMGEGGAVFVLETAERARRRGAQAYAQFAGFGATSDASHMVIPNADGQATSQAIRRALADASLNPNEVDYVNAHAAGTPVGDKAESGALHLAFGAAVADVPVSSTKSMTGHLLSGAASVEAMACLVALRHQAIPPTINLDDPDPECALHHVPHQSRPWPVRTAISNSLGFGGSNTCVVLRKVA